MIEYKIKSRWSFFLLVATVLYVGCSSNINIQHKKEEEISSFLKFYQKNVLKKDSILLLKNAFDYRYPDCLNTFLKEKKYKEFDEEDFSKTAFEWDKNTMPSSKLIKNSDIPDYRTPDEWRNFRKKYGEGYYVISKPIVSNDLKNILIYTAYYCGDRCGYDQLALYQKTVSGWKLVKKYCDGVS